MKIYDFSFQPIDSKMYILIEGTSAVVIDPCICEDAYALLEHHHVEDVRIILTHEHYDHISGVNDFVSRFSCPVLCSEICGANIEDPVKNISKYYDIIFLLRHGEISVATEPYVCSATDVFRNEMRFMWEGHSFYLRETPGHSGGSICILVDQQFLFTGDSLTKHHKIFLEPKVGKEAYQTITVPFLCSLRDDLYVYPGHGESDWKREFTIFYSPYKI